MNQLQNKNKGFTLAEVLIAITLVIILSLAILTTVNPIKMFFRGYDAVRKSDLAKLKTAFEEYYTDHECYPDSTVLSQCGSNILNPYLNEIPCDPNTKQPYTLNLLPTGSSCAQKFAIYAPLINTSDGQGNQIDFCNNTYAVSSSDINYTELIAGCSGRNYCSEWYGCKSGACIMVSYDDIPTCGPNTNCDSTCGAPNGMNPNTYCAQKNRRGNYVNECR